MIDLIYNKKNRSINWNNVWSIREFNMLKNTQQSSRWHKEGNVSVHTEMVVNEMIKYVTDNKFTEEHSMILILAALFHDIGKGETTFYNKEREDWSSANHASVGEFITRRLLIKEDIKIRECICYLVRNHMKLPYIYNNTNSAREIITLSCDGLYDDYCTIENLYILSLCDKTGSIFEGDEWRRNLEFSIYLANYLKCSNKRYVFKDNSTKWAYFNDSVNDYPDNNIKNNINFTVYVAINCDYTKENIDIIKCNNNAEEYIDKIIEYCDYEKDFIITSNDSDEDNFDYILSMIYLYNANIVFVYGGEITKITSYISPTKSMEYIFN